MRRLKQLEDENAKLRKVVADLSLDKEFRGPPPKTLRLSGSASWLTRSVANGMFPSSGGLAVGAVRNPLSPQRFQCPSEAPGVTVACGVPLLSRKPLYPVATSLWTIPTWPRF
jgi:hypothetical protein